MTSGGATFGAAVLALFKLFKDNFQHLFKFSRAKEGRKIDESDLHFIYHRQRSTAMTTQSYPTSFKRHISYFDLNKDGLIRPGESLRGLLGLGYDFPAAVVFTFGLHLLYGNSGWFRHIIEVKGIKHERTMLENTRLEQKPHTRSDVQKLAWGRGWTDKIHITGLWFLAADNEGLVSPSDISLFQKGNLLPELAKRRRTRKSDNVLPLWRGGPIW